MTRPVPTITKCARCGVPCKVAAARTPGALPIVESLTGRGCCPNCAVTCFIRTTEFLRQIVGGEPMGAAKKPLVFRGRTMTHGDAHRFPEAFRLPHIQEAFAAMLRAGNCPITEIDWDEVIANWDLPIPDWWKGYA